MVSDDLVREFIEWCGSDIPDPHQYPIRFRFMIRSFEHYKRMEKKDES
jgi:hypothetical protein